MLNLNGQTILITGETGSLGQKLTEVILERWPDIKRLVIFSRDEQKQLHIAQNFLMEKYPAIRYFKLYGLRSFNPKNAFIADSSVRGLFLNRNKEGKPLLVTGDGSQKRDFIYVQDLAKANYLAAVDKDKLNTSFNVGFGAKKSAIELAKLISTDIEFIPLREGEAEITFADNSKAKTILSWNPSISIEDYVSEIK